MESSLVISFANKQEVSDSYWLRMELVEEDTQMTVGEAATLIDELYHTSICGEEREPLPTPEDGSEAKPSGTDWTTALQMLNLPTCDAYNALNDDNPGGYEADIKVYRSHQRELYKLILSNGYAGSPRRMEERVELTLTVDGQSSIALDTPIVARPRIAWTDIDGPDINIKGNTLWWEGSVTGTIRAEFDTVYDLVHIWVTGTQTGQTVIEGTGDPQWLGAGWYSGSETGEELTEVQDIQCSVLAFYHYQYEELILNRPEMDESVDSTLSNAVCMQQGSVVVEDGDTFNPEDEPTAQACKEACARMHPAGSQELADCQKACERICYKTVRYETVCECGGEESTQDIDVPVNCPDGYTTGSRINSGEPSMGGFKYIGCGYDSNVHEPWFYEQKCCHGWPFGDEPPMPKCEVHYGPFTNKPTERDKIAEIHAAYGEDANIISVGPKEGRCGDTVTTQDVPSNDCCNETPEILWDYENSAEVINAPGSAIVFITGGKPPFSWQVRKEGVSFDQAGTIRDIVTTDRWVTVYADDEVCGSFPVYVTDDCSSVSEKLRSTLGVWDKIWEYSAHGNGSWYYNRDIYPPGGIHPISGGTMEIGSYSSDNSYRMDTIDGDKKILEHVYVTSSGSGGPAWPIDSGLWQGKCDYHCYAGGNGQYEWWWSMPSSGEFPIVGNCYDSDFCNLTERDYDSPCTTYCYTCDQPYKTYQYHGGPWRCNGLFVTAYQYYEWVCG